VTQRVGRGIALLFHDRGTRRGWVVSSTRRPHFTPGKEPVPILQEAGWVLESAYVMVKVKVKFALEQATKPRKGSRRIAQLFL